MKIMHIKIITLFIVGVVFTAGFIMGLGGYVFAGTDYNSSISNSSSLSVAKVNEEVGNILLRYNIGGAEINKVTDALAAGIAEEELITLLTKIGLNAVDVKTALAEFDKLGIASEDAAGSATPIPSAISPDAPVKEFTESATPSAVDSSWKSVTGGELRTPDAGGAVPSASEGSIKDILPSKREVFIPGTEDIPVQGSSDPLKGLNVCKSFPPGKCPGIIKLFHNDTIKSIQDLKAAESDDQRENIRKELRANRQTLQENVQTLRQDLRENAQELRENFRENVRTTIGHVDHGKTARIALAHGKGLRMINRYRSAIARFDHILGRLESRIEKIGIEIEMQAEGNITRINRPGKETIALIEEAKNTQVLNKAKLAELEAKYESLLLGKNSGGVAKEARAIAKELKSEIEKLHGLLDDIRQATGTINTTKSNTF